MTVFVENEQFSSTAIGELTAFPTPKTNVARELKCRKTAIAATATAAAAVAAAPTTTSNSNRIKYTDAVQCMRA